MSKSLNSSRKLDLNISSKENHSKRKMKKKRRRLIR